MPDRGTGRFPSNAACICGTDDPTPCLGSDHQTVWEDNQFKGSTCERHGGHKFQPVPDKEYTKLEFTDHYAYKMINHGRHFCEICHKPDPNNDLRQHNGKWACESCRTEEGN